MKALLGIIALSSLASTAEAALRQDGFQLKIDFQYQKDNRKIQMKSNTLVATDNPEWTPVSGQEGVALLAKVASAEGDMIETEYMIIDTKVTPVRVSKMKITSKVRQRSEISEASTNTTDAIKVGLLAIPTRVTAD